jgi:hypothetical protein
MKLQLLFFISLFFISCAGIKNAQLNEDPIGSKDKSMKYFIVTKEGQTIQMKQFKETPTFASQTKIILDDGTKVAFSDIKSLQSDEGFYTRSTSGSMVKRIRKGLLNVYSSRELIGSDAGKPQFALVAWIQKGDASEIVRLRPKVLKELVMDYEPALEIVKKLSSTSLNYKVMEEAIEEYNAQRKK